MGLQSQKRTKSSKKRRASHFALKKKGLSKCEKCGMPVKSHYTCTFCGIYKGKKIVEVKSKKKKKFSSKRDKKVKEE